MEIFWASFGSLIVGMLIGGAIGFFFTRKMITKQYDSQMNEKTIRAMYRQMGVKPSEAKIRATMKAMGKK